MIATSMWGFVTGIALVKSGLTEGMAALMTFLVYAGSAQLTALPLIVTGAPLWLIFAAGFVVNIRFIIFGAALQPYFRHYPWFKRLWLGYLSSDIVFVLFMSRYGEDKVKGSRDQLWFYLGVIIPGWLSWQISSFSGVYLGSLVPESWSLEFAATLALMAIVIPLVKSRPMVVSLLVAAFIAWLGQPLPLRLGLAAAVIGGVVAGVIAEKYAPKKKGRRA
ncbi:MAG TPA: AzlC family ABC transporter permease [Eoetvoesiella sp.]